MRKFFALLIVGALALPAVGCHHHHHHHHSKSNPPIVTRPGPQYAPARPVPGRPVPQPNKPMPRPVIVPPPQPHR